MKEAFKRAAAAKAEVKIEPAKDVFEVDAAEKILLAEAFHSGKSAGIVFGAFLRVGQYRIGLGDFLESFLGPRFLVAIRVVFQREAAESILDRFLFGIPGNAKYLVVIALGGFRNDISPGSHVITCFLCIRHRRPCRGGPIRSGAAPLSAH